MDYHDLKRDLLSIEGVEAVHNLHVWSLTMDKGALAVHLAIRKFFLLFVCFFFYFWCLLSVLLSVCQ